MLYKDGKTKEMLHICDNCMSELGHDYITIELPYAFRDEPLRIEACSERCLASRVRRFLCDVNTDYRNALGNKKALDKWADMLRIEKDLRGEKSLT